MVFGQPEPEQVNVAGIDLRCEICKHDRFYHRRAQMNTSIMSFFGLDWLNQNAECLLCARCGYIHWFAPMNRSEDQPDG